MKIEPSESQLKELNHLTILFDNFVKDSSKNKNLSNKLIKFLSNTSKNLNYVNTNPTHENFLEFKPYLINDLFNVIYELTNNQYLNIFSVENCNLIKDIFKLTVNITKEYNDYLDNIEEQNYDKLHNIAENNNLKTIWSISEIPADKMNEVFSDDKVEISYANNSIKLKKMASWLDIWKAADQLIKLSGDSHHIFIENFEVDKNKKNHFKLTTGS